MSMLTIFLIAIGIAVLIAGAHFALIFAIKPRKAQGDDVRHRDSKRG